MNPNKATYNLALTQNTWVINKHFFNNKLLTTPNVTPFSFYEEEISFTNKNFINEKKKLYDNIVVDLDTLDYIIPESNFDFKKITNYLMEVISTLVDLDIGNYIFKSKVSNTITTYNPVTLLPEEEYRIIVYPYDKINTNVYRLRGNNIIGYYFPLIEDDYWGQTIPSPGSGTTTGHLFPIVQRVASTLVGQNIVSVQPLSLPIGKLFYLNPPQTGTIVATTNYVNP